jgi:hypothetical protein
MAIIPNFPQNLLDLHHNWHQPGAHPGPGARVHPFGTAGGGTEFLQFHHDFIVQFHAWYDSLPFGTAPYNTSPFSTAASAQHAVAGWTVIPPELKNGAVTGWGGTQIAQEARLTTLTPPFTSDDDIGTYIEGGIHGWIHGAAAAAYNEPVVGTFHSPLSTYFYGIHGLVDLWWQNWKNAQHKRFKDIIDTKVNIKESIDKTRLKDIIDTKSRVKELIKEQPDKGPKEIKEKDKDIFENPGGPVEGGDPLAAGIGTDATLADLQQRLADLEIRVSQQAFITPAERPMVGDVARHTRAARRSHEGGEKS